MAEDDDDLDDGDDELDDEEAEVEDEEESEGEVETPGLETLYQTAVLDDDEDDDEEEYDDEDVSEEEESDEEQESTRGKRSPTESTAGKTGKKRRLEEPSPDGDVWDSPNLSVFYWTVAMEVWQTFETETALCKLISDSFSSFNDLFQLSQD